MKKISLKSIQIESFVTKTNSKTASNLKGGFFDYDYHQNCGGSDSCYEPYTDKCYTVDCTRVGAGC